MTVRSLEDKIRSIGNPVDMLRNAAAGPYQFPIQSEFSNWRDEQEAWRRTAVLFDQSFHMTDLYVEGPDTRRLVEHLTANAATNWRRNVAKQFVACTPSGYFVGDAILFILEEDRVNIVNKPITRNWVVWHAEQGGFDVEMTTDDRALDNRGRRLGYRFEVQGPNAWAILEKVNGGPIEGIKFFRMGEIEVAGRRVRALRHGMAGEAGLELFGPFDDHGLVRDTLLEAGQEFGLLPAGSRTYSTVAHESGWFPSPMPAIYSGDDLKALPGMAARRRFRGLDLARRQPRQRRHRGLLPDALGPRIRPYREVRSRLHRPQRAGGDAGPPPQAQDDAALE